MKNIDGFLFYSRQGREIIMKKLLSLLAVMMMAMCLFACSSKDTTDDDTVTISVGLSPDYAPYESLDTAGNLVGFDIDMLNSMEKLLSEANGKTYKFEIYQMSFDNIITQIQGGQLNCGVSGFTWSEEREKAITFSTPYAGAKEVVMVLADSGYSTLADLQGKKLAAQTGSTDEKLAQEAFGKENVSSIQSVNDMIPGLDAHQYDAVVLDEAVATSYASTGKYVILDEALDDEYSYIVVGKGDDETLAIINQAVELFIASDGYKSLCEQYQISPIEVK